MHFEPWMFAAMEDEGIIDTQTGRINKVAKFLARQNLDYIGNSEFIQACHSCGIDPYHFDKDDIQKIGQKIQNLR